MEYVGILFALFYAIVITSIFTLIFRNTGPWKGSWIFFFLIFLIALGAGEWTLPIGPAVWGYYWIPGLIAAIILALLLAAATPVSVSGKDITDRDKIEKDQITEETMIIGMFFWILIIILLLVALGGMFWNPSRGIDNRGPTVQL